MTAPTALDRAASALLDGCAQHPNHRLICGMCYPAYPCHRMTDGQHVSAVLAALEPPTPGMVEAGLLAMTRDVVESGNVEAVWAAMFAAAREGA